jgi:diadenosine tetraphosphate (Ap4A) HIT family hydrolase
MSDFMLDSRLAVDTHPICDLALCHALLMDDARYPWIVLVPRRPALRELTDLDPADATLLMQEIRQASQALMDLCQPDKLNVGAIGNKVAQLHIHVVARFETDAAWPEPVWGRGARVPYGAGARDELTDRLAGWLSGPLGA